MFDDEYEYGEEEIEEQVEYIAYKSFCGMEYFGFSGSYKECEDWIERNRDNYPESSFFIEKRIGY